jgi:hypothetical protein
LNILALDLGTSTGYAFNRESIFVSGTWLLGTPKEITAWGKDRQRRNKDPRIDRLCENITKLGKFDVVIFEDVQFSKYTAQTQLWSSLRAAIWLCGQGSHFDSVPVKTLKLFATGYGGATKEAMKRALIRNPRIPFNKSWTEDEVDAIWIWLWADTNLKRMKI